VLKIAIAGYIILIHTDVDHENKTHENIQTYYLLAWKHLPTKCFGGKM